MESFSEQGRQASLTPSTQQWAVALWGGRKGFDLLQLKRQNLRWGQTVQTGATHRNHRMSPRMWSVKRDSHVHSHTGLVVGHLLGHLWMTKDTSRGNLQAASAPPELGLEDEKFRGGWGDKIRREVREFHRLTTLGRLCQRRMRDVCSHNRVPRCLTQSWAAPVIRQLMKWNGGPWVAAQAA